MKKILLIIMMLLLIVGCSKNEIKKEEKKENEIENEKTVYENLKLDGTYSDVIPLYKLFEIETNYYSIREALNYTIGKDLYSIRFNSNSTKEDASAYYQSLMNSVKDLNEEWFDPYSFSGTIKGHTVNILITKLYEDKEYITISISIGAKEEEYSDKNKFFDDYPKDLVEVYGKTRLQEETYEENHEDELKYYKTIYETNIVMEEFVAHYEDIYKEKDSFNKLVEENKASITWKDKGFDISIKYTKYEKYIYVSIISTKSFK